MKITFKDIGEEYSVCDYCRDLIKTGGYPNTLEVYRGDMLCLTVDVQKASKLRPWVYGFRKWHPR